jgi:phosphonate transport system permease protein
MRIPDFIPIIPSKRRKKELIGLIIEIVIWAYFFVVFGRIILFSIGMELIESLAYATPPSQTALGVVNWLNFDSRYFDFPWKWIFVLATLGAFVGLIVGWTGRGFGAWIASQSKLHVTNQETHIKIKKHWRVAYTEIFMLVALTVVTGWVLTGINIAEIFQPDGLQGAGRLALQLSCGIPLVGTEIGGFSLFYLFQGGLNGLVSLYNVVFPAHPIESFVLACEPTNLEYYSQAVSKLVESVYLAFIATFFSVPIAFFLSFFAARNLTRHSKAARVLYMVVRAYMNISRSIEPLIWAILFSVWIGIGPFSGMLALMVHTVSSLVKQYSEAAENVEQGPIDALESTGANRIATLWFGVVPQIFIPYLSFTLYRWDINVRMATVIGLVGGGGIGSILIQEQMLARWTQVGSLAFLIFLVVWIMDFLSARIREAIQ